MFGAHYGAISGVVRRRAPVISAPLWRPGAVERLSSAFARTGGEEVEGGVTSSFVPTHHRRSNDPGNMEISRSALALAPKSAHRSGVTCRLRRLEEQQEVVSLELV